MKSIIRSRWPEATRKSCSIPPSDDRVVEPAGIVLERACAPIQKRQPFRFRTQIESILMDADHPGKRGCGVAQALPERSGRDGNRKDRGERQYSLAMAASMSRPAGAPANELAPHRISAPKERHCRSRRARPRCPRRGWTCGP